MDIPAVDGPCSVVYSGYYQLGERAYRAIGYCVGCRTILANHISSDRYFAERDIAAQYHRDKYDEHCTPGYVVEWQGDLTHFFKENNRGN